MTTVRKRLRDEITSRLLPLLRERGFEGPDRIAGNATDHEFRRSAAAGTEVLTIQFEKYQRPRFIVNLWVEPPEGFEEVIRQGGTVVQARVTPRPGGSTADWFRADLPWWRRLFRDPATREREAVSQAIAVLPEMDAWWRDHQDSPHITTIIFKHQRPAGTG